MTSKDHNPYQPFLRRAPWIGGLLIVLTACADHHINPSFRNTYTDLNDFIHQPVQQEFLKVHLNQGQVAVLSNWELAAPNLEGEGKLFDFNRNLIYEGDVSIPVNSITLLETNEPIEAADTKKLTGLTILAIANIAGIVACAINPKACFGSCPTFYYGEYLSPEIEAADAEGFSSAIAPGKESGDVDDLRRKTPPDEEVVITMRNEALETHAVNQVSLIGIPAVAGWEVYHDGNDQFYYTSSPLPVKNALAPEGECSSLLEMPDGMERFSATDSTDLTAREELLLTFPPPPPGETALVLQFRQTLVTTFLLYTAIGYMGDEYSDFIAFWENHPRYPLVSSEPLGWLGGIGVYFQDGPQGRWKPAGEVLETGPIARNRCLVPLGVDLSNTSDSIRIKLVMSQGVWRLDYAALTAIRKPAVPVKFDLCQVYSQGEPQPEALRQLAGEDELRLATLPGDEYQLLFHPPENCESYHLFLFSKGYYLEWLREEWLLRKDKQRLRKMFFRNPGEWKNLAREYKMLEAEMENVFWNSKIPVQ